MKARSLISEDAMTAWKDAYALKAEIAEREALSKRYGVAPHWGKACADMDAQISRAFHWGRGKSA